MLEGVLGWASLDYAIQCELRHFGASFFFVGLPLLAAYLMLSGSSRRTSVRAIFPSWWWFGLWPVLGLASAWALHCAIDFDWLPGLFPSGWA